jgi:hypothetical protein
MDLPITPVPIQPILILQFALLQLQQVAQECSNARRQQKAMSHEN